MTVQFPQEHAPQRTVRTHEEPALFGLTVWTEYRPGQGEDAEPLWLYFAPRITGLLGVFDGTGGAGAGTAWSDPQGVRRTGAWVGSRLARLGAETWFADQHDGQAVREAPGHAASTVALEERLREVLQALPSARPSKVVGTMRRPLPSTMALLRYQMFEDFSVWIQALWAGDSRGYRLTPSNGLQALTRDDTMETDALAQLTQDPPMTNLISADGAFQVRTHQVKVSLPTVLLCATDGCFGYFASPGDFEVVLTDTLSRSASLEQWAEELSLFLSSNTADDVSLSLVAFGYHDFHQLRESFAERAVAVAQHHGGRPDDSDVEMMRFWREETWGRYREGYEQLMPPLPGTDPQATGERS